MSGHAYFKYVRVRSHDTAHIHVRITIGRRQKTILGLSYFGLFLPGVGQIVLFGAKDFPV